VPGDGCHDGGGAGSAGSGPHCCIVASSRPTNSKLAKDELYNSSAGLWVLSPIAEDLGSVRYGKRFENGCAAYGGRVCLHSDVGLLCPSRTVFTYIGAGCTLPHTPIRIQIHTCVHTHTPLPGSRCGSPRWPKSSAAALPGAAPSRGRILIAGAKQGTHWVRALGHKGAVPH
jgi:hypothetical protein